MNLNIKELGQVFTPQHIVLEMIQLIQNNGSILEPSCGNGAFFNQLETCTGIEFDETVAPPGAIVMDFFDLPLTQKFDTIIGNPPYVRYQDINENTKQKLDMSLFGERSNLYLFFIHKCIQHLNPHGELIFIVPKDFMKSTAAIKLNQFIYDNGSITDLIDLSNEHIFTNVCPSCIIFRFEKDNFSRKTNKTLNFTVVNGQILFTKNRYPLRFADLFYVKVGAASGCNECFVSPNGNAEFVCAKTRATGQTIRMHYNTYHHELLVHKPRLMNRPIKKFSEKDWFMWGRKYYESDANRIYVNYRAREKAPFFQHDCRAYDGSVLAVFPKWDATKKQCEELADLLNQVDWTELGFLYDGRYIFRQKSLENTVLPDTFSSFLKFVNT